MSLCYLILLGSVLKFKLEDRCKSWEQAAEWMLEGWRLASKWLNEWK